MQHTNLKPLLTLPTHPWYLGDEPTVVIAAMSTHKSGIGKRLDACDTEHMLCMVHIMYQNTLPHKNIAMKNHLDSSKYVPIMA